MMKWGYEGVKKFIGGNPVQKIINSPRQVQEGLAIDLRACNNYKNGLKATANVNCPTLCILGDKDKMVPLDKGKKMVENIKNSLKTIEEDIDREKSIIIDATSNEKRLREEKNELIEIDSKYYETEKKSDEDLAKAVEKSNEEQKSVEKIINIIICKYYFF